MTEFAALICSTDNYGDDIQTLAALQFLPPDVVFVDRDRLDRFRRKRCHKLILNGWLLRDAARWPPSKALDPLLVSIHIARPQILAGTNLAWLREMSQVRPVGARDLVTLERLREAGVQAYHSGCMTLTLRMDRPSGSVSRVCAVDLDSMTLDRLRARTTLPVVSVTHKIPGSIRRLMSAKVRRRRAAELLSLYANSTCVVTGRLHAALPSLAFGTPILFVTDRPDDARFSGFHRYLHHVKQEDFLADRYDFGLDSPPLNSLDWKPLARRLSETCSAFTGCAARSILDLGEVGGRG